MKTATLCLLASLAVGGSAFAAERAPSAAQGCMGTLAEIKASAPAKVKFSTLSPGQFHLAQGLFAATPPVSMTLPPMEGAVLITLKGAKSAKIAWLHDGKLCGGFDLPLELVKLVLSVNPIPGETIDPDHSDEERSL